MEASHSEFVTEDSNGGMLSSNELKEAIGLANKRQDSVNLTIKDSYSLDGKKYIKLETSECVAE